MLAQSFDFKLKFQIIPKIEVLRATQGFYYKATYDLDGLIAECDGAVDVSNEDVGGFLEGKGVSWFLALLTLKNTYQTGTGFAMPSSGSAKINVRRVGP